MRIHGGLLVVVGIEKWPEGRCILKGELTGFADRCEIQGKWEMEPKVLTQEILSPVPFGLQKRI